MNGVYIPTQKAIDGGWFKLVEGEWYKRCTGPSHEEPVFLPATVKYFYLRGSVGREGRLTSRCRLCCNWSKLKVKSQMNGWIPASEARPFYLEAANRIGVMELAKRTGMNYYSITTVISGRGKFVQRRTLRKVMLELVSIKRKHEYSINVHASWRVTKRATGGEVCNGCGGPLVGQTEGCDSCLDRHYAKRRRLLKAAERLM